MHSGVTGQPREAREGLPSLDDETGQCKWGLKGGHGTEGAGQAKPQADTLCLGPRGCRWLTAAKVPSGNALKLQCGLGVFKQQEPRVLGWRVCTAGTGEPPRTRRSWGRDAKSQHEVQGQATGKELVLGGWVTQGLSNCFHNTGLEVRV